MENLEPSEDSPKIKAPIKSFPQSTMSNLKIDKDDRPEIIQKSFSKEKRKETQAERHRRRRVRRAKRKERQLKEKVIKELSIPKSVFFTPSIFFIGVFMYMFWHNVNGRIFFWTIFLSIPYYYYDVKGKITEHYYKVLRKNNIPYETEQQKENRLREAQANLNFENSASSKYWDEENFCRRYTCLEVIRALIYYFFASFFPAYIEKELDIFQKQFNLMDSKKRLRDKKREYEARKQKEKEDMDVILQKIRDHDLKNEDSKSLVFYCFSKI